MEATDTDKRGELALSSLSEHLSGESKVGFNKSAALALNSLDKRELLSLWITLWITYPQAALRVNTLCVLENKSLTKERTVTMTQDEIIEMAKQAGIETDWSFDFQVRLETFAKLVAQHEREACAKWLEDVVDAPNWADVIRARGQA